MNDESFTHKTKKIMKSRFKYIMMATVAALSLASCDVSSIDDLAGAYDEPSSATITSGTMTNKTKSKNLRTFTMDFTTEQGVSVHMALASSEYYLKSNTYTKKDISEVKDGTFVSGLSTINGSSITDGSFTITKDGDDYTLSKTTLFTDDGKAYTMSGKFNYSFEPDDPTALTILKSATAGTDGTVTVVLSTGGWEGTWNATTYSMDYTGAGNDLQIVFKSSDGKLHPGTYSPGSGYVAGYDYTYELWGYTIPAQAGTLWYSVADGKQTITNVTSGDIIVTKDGANYTILLDQGKGGIYAQYTGKIADLDPDGAVAATQLTYGGGVSWIAYGGSTIALSFAAPGATISYNSTYWSFVAGGTGVAFNVEFYSTDGTLAPGTYTAADQGAVGAGNWQKGYDNGYGGFGGSVLHNVTDGTDSASALTEGTFIVTKDGDNYKITTTINGVDYEYNGPISI